MVIMRPRKVINNSIEFCDEYQMSDECREFAKQHPTLAGFWEHCERGDRMIKLLDATGYANGDKLLEFHRRLIEPQETKNMSEAEKEEWRRQFYESQKIYKEKLDKEVYANYKTNESAKYDFWLRAFLGTEYDAHEVLKDSIFDARFMAGISEQLEQMELGSKLPEEELKKIQDKAVKEAFESTLKGQADLLREVIGNPFTPKKEEEFYIRTE
jgi:hypothetical protein